MNRAIARLYGRVARGVRIVKSVPRKLRTIDDDREFDGAIGRRGDDDFGRSAQHGCFNLLLRAGLAKRLPSAILLCLII